jgi:hypothetical protein
MALTLAQTFDDGSLDRLPCEGRWFTSTDQPPGNGNDQGHGR